MRRRGPPGRNNGGPGIRARQQPVEAFMAPLRIPDRRGTPPLKQGLRIHGALVHKSRDGTLYLVGDKRNLVRLHGDCHMFHRSGIELYMDEGEPCGVDRLGRGNGRVTVALISEEGGAIHAVKREARDCGVDVIATFFRNSDNKAVVKGTRDEVAELFTRAALSFPIYVFDVHAAPTDTTRPEMKEESQAIDARSQNSCTHTAELGAYVVRTFQPNLLTAQLSYEKECQTQQLQRELRDKNYPRAKLYMFGSSVTGLAEASSDLDLAYDLHGQGSYNKVLGEREESKMVVNMEYTLRKLKTYTGLKAIPRARVPIVKNDPEPGASDVPFDISLRLFGVLNSYLLRSYLDDPAVRLAGVAIKSWSKSSKVNDPRNGFLSSYSFSLMYIYYLHRTGLVRWNDPKGFLQKDLPTCPPAFKEIHPSRELEQDVGGIVAGFFEFYVRTFDWENEVVSLCSASKQSKEDLGWERFDVDCSVSKEKNIQCHFLAIEDPYEMRDNHPISGLNTARALNSGRFWCTRLAFSRAWYNICEGDVSLLTFDTLGKKATVTQAVPTASIASFVTAPREDSGLVDLDEPSPHGSYNDEAIGCSFNPEPPCSSSSPLIAQTPIPPRNGAAPNSNFASDSESDEDEQIIFTPLVAVAVG